MSSANVKTVQTQRSINIFGWIGGWVDEYITGFTEIITKNKKQIYILGGTDVHCSVENSFCCSGTSVYPLCPEI